MTQVEQRSLVSSPPLFSAVGERSIRWLRTRLLLEFAAANFLGLSLLGVYLLIFRPQAVDILPTRSAIAMGAILLFGAIVGLAASYWVARPITSWLKHGTSAASQRLQISLVLQPAIQAALVVLVWAGLGVVSIVSQTVLFNRAPRVVFVVFLASVVPGLATAAITYLRIESRWRPFFPYVFAEEDPLSLPIPQADRLRTRMRWGFILGTAVPLLTVSSMMTLRAYAMEASQGESPIEELRENIEALRQETGRLSDVGDERIEELLLEVERDAESIDEEFWNIEIFSWFVVIGGVVIAGVMAANLRRSVTRPVEQLKRGMEGVECGDFAVSLPVDRTDEFGLLQRGFNQMVAGLRARNQLVDLFGAHVGGQVAELALAENRYQAGQFGETREVSALFVDLAAFSRLAETVSPGELAEILNVAFEKVVTAVELQGGLVNKFQGDAVLAVFGAPRSSSSHSLQAVKAAVQIALSLEELSLEFGIGISSGEVFAGNIGSETRYEYTVIGDPVNEAARLQQLTREVGEKVLLSGATACVVQRMADRRLAACLVSLGDMVLRGKSEKTSVYAISQSAWKKPYSKTSEMMN